MTPFELGAIGCCSWFWRRISCYGFSQWRFLCPQGYGYFRLCHVHFWTVRISLVRQNCTVWLIYWPRDYKQYYRLRKTLYSDGVRPQRWRTGGRIGGEVRAKTDVKIWKLSRKKVSKRISRNLLIWSGSLYNEARLGLKPFIEPSTAKRLLIALPQHTRFCLKMFRTSPYSPPTTWIIVKREKKAKAWILGLRVLEEIRKWFATFLNILQHRNRTEIDWESGILGVKGTGNERFSPTSSSS